MTELNLCLCGLRGITGNGDGTVGVLWFAIFLQLFLILGVLYTLASDSIAMHRFQVSTFGAIAIVFAVIGVQQNIFTGVPSQDALAAGWLILAIVDILWVLYFTSEEDSLALHVFNSMGTGGLTPPSRRRRTTMRTQPSVHNMPGNGGYGGYTSGGIGSHDAVPYDGKMGSPISGGMGGGMGGGIGGGAAVRSQNSFNGGQSIENGPPRSIGAGTAPGSITGPGAETRSVGGETGPGSPLMGGGAAGVGAGGGPPDTNLGPEAYSYRAKALYACKLSDHHDPFSSLIMASQILLLLMTLTKYLSPRVKSLISLISKENGGKRKKQMEQ